MNSFTFYFQLGWEHIISPDAHDHQLFIAALISLYLIKDWKQLLILVTAFTIGHSLTLALSVLDLVRFSSDWVEFLIPLTIVATAAINLIRPGSDGISFKLKYGLAAGFGLVHGLGFANNIRFIIAEDESLATNLLAFNLGLEVGQLLVVAGLLLLGYLLIQRLHLQKRFWSILLNGAAFAVALWIALHRIPIH